MSKPPSSLIVRLGFVLASLVLATLAFEGGYSLLTGASLLRGGLGAASPQITMRDRDRMAVASRTPGPYALAIDAHVGFTMKPAASLATHGVAGSTDEHGSRARVGAPPEQGALRIVLLGDSVIYGFGLDDEATLAHQLEARLAEIMRPGSARPIVSTVAVPGWNVWNCARALKNRLAELDPDIVIYTPVENDLFDSFATTEAGYRSHDFDPAIGASRPHYSQESLIALFGPMATRMSMADAMAFRAAGGVFAIPPVLVSGLTPKSRAHWQAFVAELLDIEARLAARGAEFALNLFFDVSWSWQVAARIVAHAPSIGCIPPFTDQTAADTLDDDPHPNARCVAARAACIAQWLAVRYLNEQTVPGAPLAIDVAYRDRWPDLPDDATIRARSDSIETTWAAQIGTAIDLTIARGFHQVYGGVAADSTVGRGFDATLRAAGSKARLRIARLPVESGVYPLTLRVTIGAGETIALDVPPPNTSPELEFELHTIETDAEFVDVQIRASNWILERADERSRIASFRLLRLAFEDR